MLGLAPFGVTQKKDPSGPPFVATSANNGDSVDPVTGKIVLGNDVGDAAAPAQLLSDREIVTNSAFRIFLQDNPGLLATIKLRLSEQRVLIEEQTNLGFVTMLVNGGTSQFNAQSSTPGGDGIFGASNLQSAVVFQTNGIQPFWNVQNPTTDFSGILVLGVLNIKSASGGGNGLALDSVANDVASTGTMSTANPGGGAGKWKLGKFLAGAVAPDGANYVEVEIDGVVRKLIVAV